MTPVEVLTDKSPNYQTAGKDPLKHWALILNSVHFGLAALLILGFILIISRLFTLSSFSNSLDPFQLIILGTVVLSLIGIFDTAVSIGAVVFDILYLTKRKPTGTPKVLTVISLILIGLGFIIGPIIGLVSSVLHGSSPY